MNCSSSTDYYALTSRLRHAMACRGYPPQPHISYDIEKRELMLQKLRNRTRDSQSSRTHGNVMVFKTEYVGHLKRIKLREEFDRLFLSLRQVVGDTFLRDTKVVTAHPLRSNLFRRHYRFNIIPGSMGTIKRGFREGRAH